MAKRKTELMDRLKDRFPSGYVVGMAKGIVGPLGMTIQWINHDKTVGQVKFNHLDKVSITEIKGKSSLLVHDQVIPHNGAIVSINHFQSLEVDKPSP